MNQVQILGFLVSWEGNADKSTAAMAYFITPCVATVGMLVCYLLLPHLVSTGMRTTIRKNHQNLVEHIRNLTGGFYILELLEI